MSWLLIIILIVLGLLFLLLEVLVIPGSTLAGIAGFGLLFTGLWQAYASKGSIAGHITLASTVLITIVGLYFSFKAGTWKRMALKTNSDSKLDLREGMEFNEGDTGLTMSRLAPTGKAMINDQIIEVHTYGEFIDQEKEIVVISVKDNKIIVTTKKSKV
ncbi:MAG: NfeD family protein [Bacteroidota bacterium]